MTSPVSRLPSPDPRFHDLADGALLVTYPDLSDGEANLCAVAAAARLEREKPPGFLGAVPGARTLYVEFDPETAGRQALAPFLEVSSGDSEETTRRTIDIPVVYGGAAGSDLAELAGRAHLSPEEFARRHAQASYRVAFLGFAPGFAYLTGLPSELHAPRLATPRTRVAGGTVAIGGPYTGIYPGETPGGWRLIGRSDVVLFDPEARPPSLLLPGDAVRFHAVSPAESTRMPALAVRAPTGQPAGDPLFRVLAAGALSSVQGGPRYEWLRLGVPPGGAMDMSALARGNVGLGNPPDAAALEMTLVGAELEALAEASVCLTGARPNAKLNGRPIDAGEIVSIRPGDRIAVARIVDGARTYLCVAGGFWQSSLARLSPRLSKGDLLVSHRRLVAFPRFRVRPESETPAPGIPVVRVVLGPHRDRYTEEGLHTFLSSLYRVSPASDRRGVRLEGPAISLAQPPDIPPEGTPLGGIQVASDGMPIVLGPDRPVTGGYARIGTIVRADFPLLAQASPGTRLRFSRVDLPPHSSPE